MAAPNRWNGRCLRRNGNGELGGSSFSPGSAPMWIASGFLPRFNGFLLRQRGDAGLRFLTALFEKICRTNSSAGTTGALDELDHLWQANRTFSFRYATQEEQNRLRNRHPYRIFIGTIPPGMSAVELAGHARRSGCTGRGRR